ncbi:uncharacterized protein LOC108148525 [Drosophila elegans]|uniref:uncharacterized protein LOC108148525 n=1 Tax=Drosophila elegans TaxID=30023 RepID=UPI0007E73A0D|nr:uncharacterized protein LOC108148525 [Drosophila elegans]
MASRINLRELKLMEIKSFCEKLGLSAKGNKAALIAQLSAVLPSEIAPELYYEKVESTKGGGEIGVEMDVANATNNNNEEQVGEMDFANAANNNNEEQARKKKKTFSATNLNLSRQLIVVAFNFQEPAFNRVLQPLAVNVVQLAIYGPNRVATLREWNRRCKIYVSKVWTVFPSPK